MTELLSFLENLISISGLSGYEESIRDPIKDAWRPLTDEIQISRLGSLHALRRGTADEPRPSLLIAAHMDAIGLMVSDIIDGFLRVTGIGGVDPRVLPGQLVTVHGRDELPGVIAQFPPHLLSPEERDQSISLDHLLVDVGLLPQEVERQVRIGDLISFAQPPLKMSDEILAGHSLDNRASVAALTYCLQELQGRQLNWDVWATATVQEEENLGGAFTSAFQIRPTLAIAVDVTFGAGPGSPSHMTYPLGKGITLGWGPNVHPALYKAFQELADQLEIPYKMEPLPRMSGTDAIGLQVAAEGIPTMVISIPLRYMHTPVEMVSIKDITRTGRLLAAFAAQLDDKFMDRMKWNEGS